jgi:uncharacterized membrane protein YjdF
MQTVSLLLLTLVTLAAAVYAHYRIPQHTSSARDRWFVHILLVVLGLALAWVNVQRYPISGLTQILVFASSFGVAHIPAAGILFIKNQQKKT